MDIAMKALSQLDTHCGEISDQRAATKEGIHKTLREAINVKEVQLIDQLDQMTREKLKGLAV